MKTYYKIICHNYYTKALQLWLPKKISLCRACDDVCIGYNYNI